MILNLNSDNSSIDGYSYCQDVFGSIPNKVSIHVTYLTQLIKNELDYDIVNNNSEIIYTSDSYILNTETLVKINDDIYLKYSSIDTTQENSISSGLVFYYKNLDNLETVNTIIDKISECIADLQEDYFEKVNVLNVIGGVLDVEPVSSSVNVENTDLYYSGDTMKNVNRLVKKLKRGEPGISVLYGERGTGKTSIINYISDNINRTVIYIPNNLLDISINNPEFLLFLKRFSNPVLVIDDCEDIFNSHSNSTNLIQIVDGIRDFNFSIITIFNTTNVSRIDSNILNCNNFTDMVYFDCLDLNEIKELCHHLKIRDKYKNKARLIDIIRKSKTVAKKIGLL